MAKSDQEETIEEGRRGLPVRLEMKTRVKKNLLLKETQNGWLQWRKKKPIVISLQRLEKVVWNRGESRDEEEVVAHMMVPMAW